MPAPIIQDNINATKLMRYCKQHENDECKVLDKDEEQKLIAELKHDPEKLQKALIMHNVAMVFNLAAKYMTATKSFDETVQYGLYGLCYAAKKFNPDQTKTKFSTYAYNWVFKYVWWTYWGSKNDKDVMNSAISLNSAVSDYSSDSKTDGEGDLGNYLENHINPNDPSAVPVDPTGSISAKNIYKDLQKYMLSSDFTDLDRLVFDNSFVNDSLTLKQISSNFDVPIKEVKSSYSKILDLLKTKLKEKNITSIADIY